jgi:hypothetical protein
MLSGVLPSFEMLMTRWEKLAEDVPTLKKFIDPGLQKAYEYYKSPFGNGPYAKYMTDI